MAFGLKTDFVDKSIERPADGSVSLKTSGASVSLPKPLNGTSSRAAEALVPTTTELPAEQVKSEEYYDIKQQIFAALIEVIDVSQLSKMDIGRAREEVRDVVNEIVVAKKVAMSAIERQELLEDICNDVLGYGPLEPLLARDDIADIMVNGSNKIFIEVDGKIFQTPIRFRDHSQLLNVCQRIVS